MHLFLNIYVYIYILNVDILIYFVYILNNAHNFMNDNMIC